MSKVLEVKNLSVSFRTLKGEVQAVRDVSFDIEKGSVTAIVGESGCGKSVTSKSIMGLIKKPGYVSKDSQIIFQGENIQEYNRKQWEAYRGPKCSICFQDALTALNPTMTVGKQIMEKIRVHKKVSKQEAWAEAVQMLERVGIPNPELRMKQYPHEFSGGMRQRVMIAIAMTLNPDLLIADEPTTALDVTVQADILDMMKEIQKEHPMSIILITHDLGIVANFATDIIVMYAGKIVERGTAEDIFYHPTHPYTKALLRAVPRLDMEGEKLETIEGAPPNMINPPKGCPFAQRCKERMDICETAFPEESKLRECHEVCCWLQKEGR
ncbi:ABC transporter ATP-binding protein [Dorea formicigenerans]|jgi:oligopeptide/dipeptide ABC transporter ATP-binding protein|uniref:ABC transporter ATP-binding protein n=1 Tax=Dorea formicigenerans TaxID=39486 RepID=A0A3E4PCL8_9FIRM|nr:ABC transporter ATP-binding protein [Dorea formicigenerans]RGK77772.1 ABC transporter ATP-binding protein [Dorea formicigenerans]